MAYGIGQGPHSSRGCSWRRRRRPGARSAGTAIVHDGLIYVAGGRPPRGHDFAVYDPAADAWEVLPDLPSQRNHIIGAAIDGRIHVVGGRRGDGLIWVTGGGTAVGGSSGSLLNQVYRPALTCG